jgi:hypothetical protein
MAPSATLRSTPLSFWRKALLSLLLVVAADWLFWMQRPGSSVGVFALGWLLVLVLARPALLRDGRARVALFAAAVFGLVLLDRPGAPALLLFGLGLMVAALSVRTPSGEGAWRWAQRLAIHGAVSLAGPWIDAWRLSRLRRKPGPDAPALARLLVLPVLGGGVFLGLFAVANPIVADLLSRLRLPALSAEQIGRTVFWAMLLVPLWSTMRPRRVRRVLPLPGETGRPLPGVGAGALILSLIVFNAVFALQNGLDIAFLWSGAPLPGDVTLADYAHRGAYTLIATAVLAGLFVLVALRSGSETARRPLVRRLVVLWVGQNLLLVASSMLRLADYIEAFALTRLRIAALLWMALVGVGLLLICWRLLAHRGANWLINANVAATVAVLSVASVVDLGAVAANWNVRHAREVGGAGAALDLCYLDSLGAPALVALARLETTTDDPDLRERVMVVRRRIGRRVATAQYGLRGWVWRDARRLSRVAEITPPRWIGRERPGRRDCDGRLLRLPPVLTATAGV